MVDAGTQYSPPNQSGSPSTKTPTAKIAGLQLTEKDNVRCIANEMPSVPKQSHAPAAPKAALADGTAKGPATTPSKRQAVDSITSTPPATNGLDIPRKGSAEPLQSKRARPEAPAVRFLPAQYENCNTRDLVILISSMLMELIRYNDAIPLREGHLTRFHSRAPPAISVLDYLQRLTTHATLSPPILLSMVYYIDRLCALYPAFTISSLTVHRFLIVSATVASKGLSDSFWTNKTYARVGGVSMKELALLELEFLTRMDWRIVPKPEVLCDYYRSLIERSSQYELER